MELKPGSFFLATLALFVIAGAQAKADIAGMCVNITSDKDLAGLRLRKRDIDDKAEFLEVYTTRGSDTAAELTVPRNGQCMPYLDCKTPWNCERKPRCVYHAENGDLILSRPHIFVESWGYEDSREERIRFYFSGPHFAHRYENDPDHIKLDEAPLLIRITKFPKREIADCLERQ